MHIREGSLQFENYEIFFRFISTNSGEGKLVVRIAMDSPSVVLKIELGVWKETTGETQT
jgi:hypothetical protein